MENIVNNFATTLGADCLIGATSITTSAAAPAGLGDGNFRIKIGAEILMVTAGGQTTTWTVTRAQEGTSAAAHSNGSAVDHILTAGALRALIAEPVSVPVSYPALSSFTSMTSSGTPTVTDTGRGIRFAGANASLQAYQIALGVTAPYSIVAAFTGGLGPENFNSCGILLKDNASGKHIRYEWIAGAAALKLDVNRYSDDTTQSLLVSSLTNTIYQVQGPGQFLRIRDDGSYIWFGFSGDGENFIEPYFETHGWVSVPSHAGIVCASSTNYPMATELRYFKIS